MNGSIIFRCSGQAAEGAIATALSSRGLRVMRSFDLQTSRAAAADCSCEHHGTQRCTCEYFVLLVYGAGASPAVITVHGRDARLYAQVVEESGLPFEPILANQVELGLLVASTAVDPRDDR